MTIVRPILFVLVLLMAACQQAPAGDTPVITSSPSGQSTAPPAAEVAQRGNALVRAVQALPADATLDVYADTNRVFVGLAFKAVTAYQELKADGFTFRLRPAGLSQAEPLASVRQGLDDGKHYTVFVLPGDGSAAMLHVATDEQVAPSVEHARVRVVHGSRDAGTMDVYAAGRNAPLFSGVAFQAVTGYNDVAAFNGSLALRPAGEPEAMLTVPNVSFEAGKAYTVVVTGSVRTSPALAVFLIEDRAVAAQPQ